MLISLSNIYVFIGGVLGIPGLDESFLPRWIGYGFGSLLLLNHFLGSNSATTLAQLVRRAIFVYTFIFVIFLTGFMIIFVICLGLGVFV